MDSPSRTEPSAAFAIKLAAVISNCEPSFLAMFCKCSAKRLNETLFKSNL